MPAVLAVQHSSSGGPGRVGDWLAASGITVEVIAPYDGQPVPDRLEHDALLVLGGGYLPDDDGRAPWLAPTRSLVSQALDRSIPMLGICLGGQMLAHVAGGVVEGDVGAPETGSTPITIRAAAEGDPLFHSLPRVVPAIEHHVDAVTRLPSDAVWLAETERCPYQAFRVGDRAWGVQFHPEVAPERLRRWDSERLRAQGLDPETLYATAVADDAQAAPAWHTVIDRFAAVVAATAG
ncbi:MAG TPA: type 1 glutamine amidotransferase [Actinopolymorphaceae bacterium]